MGFIRIFMDFVLVKDEWFDERRKEMLYKLCNLLKNSWRGLSHSSRKGTSNNHIFKCKWILFDHTTDGVYCGLLPIHCERTFWWRKVHQEWNDESERENKQTPTPTICIHLSTIYGRRILVVDRLVSVPSRLDKQIITARAREWVGEMELYLFIHFTSKAEIWCSRAAAAYFHSSAWSRQQFYNVHLLRRLCYSKIYFIFHNLAHIYVKFNECEFLNMNSKIICLINGKCVKMCVLYSNKCKSD